MAQITKKDIKEAVGQKIEQEFLASALNRVKNMQKTYYTKPDEIMDLCPYCNEARTFPNTKEMKEVDGQPHLVLQCPECHNTVYAHFRVIENGDMFSGYTYECIVTTKKADTTVNVMNRNTYHAFPLRKYIENQ